MSGTKAGAQRAMETLRRKLGDEAFNRQIRERGSKGGSAPHTKPRGFASDHIGEDGLTGKQRAIVVGARGGKTSRKGGS